MPSIPRPARRELNPSVITRRRCTEVSVSGVENNKTVACNDGYVNVSGVRNTVNITGHCMKVTVSGMNNIVTVDIADVISAAGFDNRLRTIPARRRSIAADPTSSSKAELYPPGPSAITMTTPK